MNNSVDKVLKVSCGIKLIELNLNWIFYLIEENFAWSIF